LISNNKLKGPPLAPPQAKALIDKLSRVVTRAVTFEALDDAS
jgi:hypothetical protein